MKKIWILARKVNVCEGHGDYRDYLTIEKPIGFESAEAALTYAVDNDIYVGGSGVVPIDLTIFSDQQ